jgi:MoxR-like ATPase/enamine deaminase RidA (YjgF/YER057c/UK114 family)
MNPAETPGRKLFSPAFLNRFRVKWVGELNPSDLSQIIAGKFGELIPQEASWRILRFHEQMKSRAQELSNAAPQEKVAYTIRNLERWLSRVRDNSDTRFSLWANLAREAFEVYGNQLQPDVNAHNELRKDMERFLTELFGDFEYDEVVYDVSKAKLQPDGQESCIQMVGNDLCEVPSTRKLMRKIAKAFASREHVLLVGPTGGGKTALVKHIAARVGARLEIIDLDGQTDTAQLLGSFAPTGEVNRPFAWISGILTEAARNGWWILLDEINLAEPDVIERINSILDDDRFLMLSEHENEEIKVHPNFRLIAAMNPATYAGRKVLSFAMENKFSPIWVPEEMPEAEEIAITSNYLSQGLAMAAASFLKRKGLACALPSKTESLPALEDASIKSIIQDLERQGVEITLAPLKGALALRSAEAIYLNPILFNERARAPPQLVQMLLCHEQKPHDDFAAEVEAVKREIQAFNSFSLAKQQEIIAWAKWYLTYLEEVEGLPADSVAFDSFLNLASAYRKNKNRALVEIFVAANYPEYSLQGPACSCADFGSSRRVFACVASDCGSDLREETRLALLRLEAALKKCGADKDAVVQQVVFLRDRRFSEAIREEMREFFGEILPPTNFIVQPLTSGQGAVVGPPIAQATGHALAIESWAVVGKDNPGDVVIRRISDYATVVRHDGLAWLHAAGILPSDRFDTDMALQARSAFENLWAVVEGAGFKRQDVIRCWNYMAHYL